MKKKTVLMFIIIIVCFMIIVKLLSDIRENKERILELENRTAGMTVTMLGASNMKENGNLNSCGYVIRTTNEKLILVDGGRDIDATIVLEYIEKYGNGVIDYWFLTHAHADHVGALTTLLEKEDITIENLCYSFNSLEWYKEYDERGFESEEKMIQQLENPKIKNRIECQKGQMIEIDNIICEILRIADPEIIHSDNGNDSSMVFKMIAKDVNKSMIFLGDAYLYTSKELMENPEKLKADAVQMAHHGQNGVTREVYEAIDPKVCFFNAPEWLYNNDSGNGYDSGKWQSVIVRGWMNELETKNIVAYQGDRTIKFTSKGIEF